LIPSILIRKPPLHFDQAPRFVLADDAVDFMITGKAAKLMMAKSAFRAMEFPTFFDDGCHLSLRDCYLPHMSYQTGSAQPFTIFSSIRDKLWKLLPHRKQAYASATCSGATWIGANARPCPSPTAPCLASSKLALKVLAQAERQRRTRRSSFSALPGGAGSS